VSEVWVELGSVFAWVRHGLGLFVWLMSKEWKIGVFKHLTSSPKPFERVY